MVSLILWNVVGRKNTNHNHRSGQTSPHSSKVPQIVEHEVNGEAVTRRYCALQASPMPFFPVVKT